MLTRILLIVMFFQFIVTANGHAQTKTVSLLSEIRRLKDVSQLPKYLDGTTVQQFSSYDRTGMNNDGFSGQYSYIRKQEDGSLVIFEDKGSGVIERFWTPTPTDDTLDFYFDGSSKPSFSIRFNDLYSGKVYPFVEPLAGHIVGGFYSYVPIPYKNGCKIVFRGKKILFHQVQYRKYPEGTNVKTFQGLPGQETKQAIDELLVLWKKDHKTVADLYENAFKSSVKKTALKPGQQMLLAEIRNGGRITGIEIDDPKLFEGLQKDIDLKISYDDESRPAVYVPVQDFFGYAFGERSMKSLLIGSNHQMLYCYFPMPFDNKARVELVYRKVGHNQQPVNISARVYYDDKMRSTDKEGKFYAYWKRDEPALGSPYVFIDGKGKGHYVGTILQAQATEFTHFTEFFEGDDSTVIDGINSLHGTGSEDYFNGGWYAQPGGWVEKKGTNLHGCLDYSLPYSRTGGYRFYISDKLPFGQSIYHSMEHGPDHNNREVDYISVAMYYAPAPIASSLTITNSNTLVFIPDTLTFYTRLMDHLGYSGDLLQKDGNGYFESGNGILSIRVNEVPAGHYKLIIHGKMKNAAGIEMAVFDQQGKQGEWKKIESRDLEGEKDFVIGDIEVKDPSKPVKLAMRAGKETAFEFTRVMLKR